MSEDRIDHPPTDGTTPPPEANGHHADTPPAATDLRVELAKLRAHVAKLRHWCRNLVDGPTAAGVLPADLAADLRATPPAMTEDEVMDLFLALAKGEPVPATHPAFTRGPSEPVHPQDAVVALSAVREQLRQAFFALYDHLYPGDMPTEEELLREMQQPSGMSISDILDEFEREYGR
jgi:hypothetical protein